MATSAEIKSNNNTLIRLKTAPKSITKVVVADQLDAGIDYTTQEIATREATANKSLNVTTDGDSDIKYPSVKAVKTYVDANSSVPKTAGTIEADNVLSYKTLEFDLNTVNTTGGNDKVVLPTTTVIGKEVLVFAENNANAFTVKGNQAGTSVLSPNGISSQVGNISVAPNISYRFIHLGSGYWKAELIS